MRAAFIARVNRDGEIDYLDFWRETGYPYELVEKVLAELVERKLLEVVD